MAIPSSGAISLSTIQTEFGGANPISLSEYYAGGGLVPPGTTGTYGAVPSSGAISIQNFYGTSNVVISITDQYVYDFDSPDAYAYYFLTAGGQVEQSLEAGGNNPTNLEQWCTPTNQSSNYEAFITITGGTLSGGSATGTWLALSTTRNWFVTENQSGQQKLCQFTVQIRKIGTGTVLDTATIDLEASAA